MESQINTSSRQTLKKAVLTNKTEVSATSRKRSHLFAAALALCMAGGLISSKAAPIGPAFPPPGGVTATNSGTLTGGSTGRTNFYTGMDPASYDELYWTFSSINNPRHSSQGASTGLMFFSAYDPVTGISTWDSSANMDWNTASGTESIPTKLVLQFQPYTGTNSGLLGSGWLVPVTAFDVDIATLDDPNWTLANVAAISAPDDNFQVWFQYRTSDDTPLLVYYDNSNNISVGNVLTSASGGFYSVIPEPSTYVLCVLGLGSVLFFRRRANMASN